MLPPTLSNSLIVVAAAVVAIVSLYTADTPMALLALLVCVFAARLQFSRSLKAANAQLQSANEELRKRSFLDPLTGLPNRVQLENRLAKLVLRSDNEEEQGQDEHGAEHKSTSIAVLIADLDGFKPVNDAFGHAIGDLVLKEAGSRLRRLARTTDMVARLGGDEFVLLMEDVRTHTDCAQLADRLVKALAQPFDVGAQQIEISCSVGVVIYPDQGPGSKLLHSADSAMHAAKRAGGNGYALFEPKMEDSAMDQLGLHRDLRNAVELGQLQLYYQPKVGVTDGRVKGMEALLRWDHPERGIIGPEVFIPLAERFGLINGLGNWVINEVCRQMLAWSREGMRMSVAINLSMHQLRQDDLVDNIRRALKRHEVEPSQLMCELTESVAMNDIEATQSFFRKLAAIGVRLSIDDFGTGYSSLSYLRQLPARQLKIDRSFISDLETNSDACAIVKAVINLAHVLDLSVVAEGVETEGQRKILEDLKCDELQGFFFSRPMLEDKMIIWVDKQEAAARKAGSAGALDNGGRDALFS
jgi:diguanylate cyclase (GGDEF)-like protein